MIVSTSDAKLIENINGDPYVKDIQAQCNARDHRAVKPDAKWHSAKWPTITATLGPSFRIAAPPQLSTHMAQAAETATTIKRLSGSENLKRHESFLEEMRKHEADKSVTIDRAYRYEFAQPVDDGKLYADDALYGRIRHAGWEPHHYAFDTKEVGGSTRCWKVGAPVIITKQSKASSSVISVIPVLFLRGSGASNKHRVLLYAPSPSSEFKALNRGLSADSKYASRLLDTFSEGALHADGELLKADDLQRFQEEAAVSLLLESKAKATTNAAEDELDDGQRNESAPEPPSKRVRGGKKHHAAKSALEDEPSEPIATKAASQLHEHVQHEKEHEKEQRKELKKLCGEIEGLKGQIRQLAEEVNNLKRVHANDKESHDEKFKKLKSKINASLHQPQLATVQMAAPVAAPLATTVPQAAQAALPQLPAELMAAARGGIFYIPSSAQQAALSRLG